MRVQAASMIGMYTDVMVDLAPLMASYCDGDASAFRALYGAVAPRLLVHLAATTRDAALASSLLQQTFLRLHHTRHAYIRGTDPEWWIYAISSAVVREVVPGRNSRLASARG